MIILLRVRLSVMMLLEYAIWGAWAVPMASYMLAARDAGGLGFTGKEVGAIYATNAIGAIISPFVVGLLADRYFSTQRFIGALHLIGAVCLWQAARTTDFATLYTVMLVYNIAYMPTIALTNSLSFRQMDRPDQQFPGVRVFGTIGWIIIGLLIGIGFKEVSGQPLLFAAGLSAVLGIYSFYLPHTPPTHEAGTESVGIKALGMLKQRSFAVFMVVAFLIAILMAFYYQLANPFLHAINAPKPQALMTIGQFSEMLLLPLLPWFIARLGLRWTIALGMLAWVLRYGIFSSQLLWPVIILGLPLHGVCFDFFFVTAQIYVDEESPLDIRASAQGMLTLVTSGLGMFVGNLLAGNVLDFATRNGATNYTIVWLVPFVGATIALLLFLMFFRVVPKMRQPAQV